MKLSNKIKTSILLLLAVLIVSCTSSSQSDKTKETGSADKKQAMSNTQIEEMMVSDTLRVHTTEIDKLFSNEYSVDIFNKLKKSKIKYATREIENLHVDEKDKVHTFKTDDTEYLFLEVTNNKSLFLLHVRGNWKEDKLAKITGIKDMINTVVNNTNFDRQEAPTVCYSNEEDMANLFITYTEDNKLAEYYYTSWVD